ncbi:MFS transporter [Paractinoplanes rishiriensis]|uniref:MFS transporter n=1 Tax=Paractinoplanes rishiriensis TaxID=1050105 RepID=A0A919MT00_9ACTN|nr:MFS transporter [Actinoplanes rishiriensis]GIE93729.1 MFS transporter [Actinoplanes rishiriensis]
MEDPVGTAVRRPWDLPDFRLLWTAGTVSVFGSHVTLLAVQVLAAVVLQASATQMGLLSAAGVVPYLLMGLIAGVISDRYRRKPMMVGTDAGRALLLCVIPLLYAVGQLTFPALLIVVAAIGVLSLFFDASAQAFMPTVVRSPGLLTAATARAEQSAAVAQTAGPLLAGVLIRTVGAPVAFLIDAVSFAVSGLLISRIRVGETVRPAAGRRGLWAELREGLAWVYQHRMLAPMALSGHLWFLAHSVLIAVFVLYQLRGPADGGLGLNEFQLSVTYAGAGLGAVLGGAAANRCSVRFGPGRTMVATRVLMPLPWLLVAFAVPGPAGWAMLIAGQFLFWIAMGVEGPNELAYRQSVTPDRLQGRMNTTIRSLNRGMIVIGAPAGGLLADATSFRTAVWAGIGGLVLSAAYLALSPFRHADLPGR